MRHTDARLEEGVGSVESRSSLEGIRKSSRNPGKESIASSVEGSTSEFAGVKPSDATFEAILITAKRDDACACALSVRCD